MAEVVGQVRETRQLNGLVFWATMMATDNQRELTKGWQRLGSGRTEHVTDYRTLRRANTLSWLADSFAIQREEWASIRMAFRGSLTKLRNAPSVPLAAGVYNRFDNPNPMRYDSKTKARTMPSFETQLRSSGQSNWF